MIMRFLARRALDEGVTIAVATAALVGCQAPVPREPPRGVSPPAATTAAPPPAAPTAAAAPAPTPRTAPRPRARRAPAEGAAARRQPCRVVSVHDGDTIGCGGLGSVRLLLIDAPELDQRPFGDRARRELAALVPIGSTVTLEFDQQRRDRYERLLAYVHRTPDSASVNETMVRSGYAVVLYYAPNGRGRLPAFEQAAAEARAERHGLYAEGGFSCEPREHRRKRC